MRLSRLLLAALALLVALACAAFAGDLRAWDDHLAGARPDVRERVPFNAAERLLDVDDDLELREAVAAYRSAGDARRRAEAETLLAELARRDPDPGRASQAATLLGILTYVDSTRSGRRTPTPIERSVAEFQTAVRLDPANEAAKYDLELLLRRLEARGIRPGRSTGPGGRATGRRGGGAELAGRGY